MRKIKTHLYHPTGKIFSKMAFINSFAIGLIFPIFPGFVKSMLHTEYAVSIFYSVMALMMFIAAIASTIIFKKVERTTITKASLLISGIIFFLLTFVTEVYELATLQSIRVWFNLFLLMTIALFIREFTKAERLGEQEGMSYRASAWGFLLGPLIGGFLANQFSYEFVFISTATILFIGLIHFYHLHIIQKHPAIINRKRIDKTKLINNFKEFFQNKNRRKVYLISITFMLWISFKRLYIPLYIVLSGYIESLTGIILALSIIPLILLEVKVGQYADKNGVKAPISLGFFIMGLIFIITFINPNPLINFFLLASINIGGAMVEPLQEYYLFKNLNKEKEDDLYGIYMTADPIAFFITPAIGALILFYLPFQYLFLVFGIIMLSASFFTKLNLKQL